MGTDKYDLHTIDYSVAGWDSILATDMEKLDDVVATRIFGTIGETVAAYQAVYVKSDGKFWLAKGDGILQPALGIMIESGVADDEKRIQRVGEITNVAWTWTIGGYIYLDPDTAGSLTQTEPAANAQVLGIALSATTMFFNSILVANHPYDLGGTFNGILTASLHLVRLPLPRSAVFPADLDDSLFFADTSASASAVFSLKKNGTEFGTVTLLPDTVIDAAAAVDKSGGKVGIPITAHGFSTGQKIIISGSTNYNDTYLVDTDSTTDEVVIVETYVAETFVGTEVVTMSWGFFVCASETSFVAGDLLTIVAPVTPDITLADLGWSLVGSRSGL